MYGSGRGGGWRRWWCMGVMVMGGDSGGLWQLWWLQEAVVLDGDGRDVMIRGVNGSVWWLWQRLWCMVVVVVVV